MSLISQWALVKFNYGMTEQVNLKASYTNIPLLLSPK